MLARVLAPILGVVLGLTLALGTAPPAGADADVRGDDAADAFVGTGGLILPPSVDEGTRREVASCTGCAWRATSPCVSTELGTPLDDACRSVVRGCPGGQLRRTWFRPPGAAWRELGLVCVGEAGLWTVADAGRAARDRLARRVPGLEPRTSPPRGLLPQLPTYFSSGMPGGVMAFDMTVAGHQLSVRASPRWSWTFGDGSVMSTDDPGGVYPQGLVTHVYHRAGRYRVDCSTTWNAEFWSDGLGPFPVADTVRQEAAVEVVVGEGRAALIPVALGSSSRGTMMARPARPS